MLFTTLRHYLGPYRGSLLAVLVLKIVETIAVLSLPTLNADIILVMEHGDSVEQGGHDELIARRGAYYGLYQSQFAGPVSEEPAVERDPLLGELGLKSRHPRNRRPS